MKKEKSTNKNKKIGIIKHITKRNKIIIESKQTPKTGSIITNEKQEPIGKVNDIFGSTKRPYISITKINEKQTKKGDILYLSKQNNKRRMKKRHQK
ncbi:MAG: Gar1/Naf1 family protein [Methanobacteriaceae archaeon]|nr:Gar1/Naf1 family protein [Methanobacteriaceae archaeon]